MILVWKPAWIRIIDFSIFEALKSFWSILLMGCLLAQAFSPLWIWVSYETQKDYITQALCENRALPQLHCKGQCQLMKKLKAESEQNNKPASTRQVFKITLWDMVAYSTTAYEQWFGIAVQTSYPIWNNDKLYTAPAQAIFHPPIV